MLSKRYESTEVNSRTWLHVPSGTHWSTSSDTHQVVEIQIYIFWRLFIQRTYKMNSCMILTCFPSDNYSPFIEYKPDMHQLWKETWNLLFLLS